MNTAMCLASTIIGNDHRQTGVHHIQKLPTVLVSAVFPLGHDWLTASEAVCKAKNVRAEGGR